MLSTKLNQKIDKRICEKLANPSCSKCYGTGIIGTRISAVAVEGGAVRTEEIVPCQCVTKKIVRAKQKEIFGK